MVLLVVVPKHINPLRKMADKISTMEATTTSEKTEELCLTMQIKISADDHLKTSCSLNNPFYAAPKH